MEDIILDTIGAEEIVAVDGAGDSAPRCSTLMESKRVPLQSRYGIGRLVGRGAKSRVFHAVETDDSGSCVRDVALKVLLKKLLSGREASCALREAALVRRLSHPNIVGLHDFYETGRLYVFALEFIPDGDLFDYILQGPIPEDEAKDVIIQIATGIDYLHRNEIVHRDVKLENICVELSDTLTRSGNRRRIRWVKIADFGLSKHIRSTKVSTPCGTKGYLAPEILSLRRGDDYTIAVDIWALGCVVFAILYAPSKAVKHFEGFQPVLSGAKHHVDFPAFPLAVSRDARTAIETCLTLDPRHRCTANTFLNMPWFTSLSRTQSAMNAECDSGGDGTRVVTRRGSSNTLSGISAGDICVPPAGSAPSAISDDLDWPPRTKPTAPGWEIPKTLLDDPTDEEGSIIVQDVDLGDPGPDITHPARLAAIDPAWRMLAPRARRSQSRNILPSPRSLSASALSNAPTPPESWAYEPEVFGRPEEKEEEADLLEGASASSVQEKGGVMVTGMPSETSRSWMARRAKPMTLASFMPLTENRRGEQRSRGRSLTRGNVGKRGSSLTLQFEDSAWGPMIGATSNRQRMVTHDGEFMDLSAMKRSSSMDSTALTDHGGRREWTRKNSALPRVCSGLVESCASPLAESTKGAIEAADAQENALTSSATLLQPEGSVESPGTGVLFYSGTEAFEKSVADYGWFPSLSTVEEVLSSGGGLTGEITKDCREFVERVEVVHECSGKPFQLILNDASLLKKRGKSG
ncbi:hypothetical protein HK101_009922 [Irineochytrium annulatum]|nr:hypothetical protein HK101_009922 [Irineochytrium annulatum]